MKLRGVDFWPGHKNTLTMYDGYGECGPITITIDEKVRQGSPFKIKIKNSPHNSKVMEFIKRIIEAKSNCAVVVNVFGADGRQYYRVEMHSFLREFTFNSENPNNDEINLTFQPREIFETYDRKLQDIFGKDLYRTNFAR